MPRLIHAPVSSVRAHRFLPALFSPPSAALAAAGNLAKDEPIPKGHTQLPWLNGRLHLGTMGFLDAVRLGSRQMEDARKARGAICSPMIRPAKSWKT
jgi:hypothetical protein